MTLYEHPTGHLCVIPNQNAIDHQCLVDFVRQDEDGQWVIWNRGPTHQSLLVDTGKRIEV